MVFCYLDPERGHTIGGHTIRAAHYLGRGFTCNATCADGAVLSVKALLAPNPRDLLWKRACWQEKGDGKHNYARQYLRVVRWQAQILSGGEQTFLLDVDQLAIDDAARPFQRRGGHMGQA